MGFSDKYVWSLMSHDLRDDARHHDLDPIAAAAIADASIESFGALLCRVKFADSPMHNDFEGNAANMAQLLRVWQGEVRKRGAARKWIRIGSERDIIAAEALYRRVAEASLAHFLDGKCTSCHGSRVAADRTICKPCKGSGEAEVSCPGGFEKERTLDMISELHAIASSHAAIAARLLRKEDQ